MNLKNRIERLEEEMEPQEKELIVYVQDFSEACNPTPGIESRLAGKFPDPEKEIERQRAEGKRVIVVKEPYGYDWSVEEKKWIAKPKEQVKGQGPSKQRG